ncbi:hypothetical protein [Novosphingobium sp. HII-3]|uniref:hypothetical protein n=1 Tax=Novosphingobium sp. HII-3 TaxID=2075565 RepID=UPI00130502B1|nr:hypothetical protein [Novosphingobium sp. HII-3]
MNGLLPLVGFLIAYTMLVISPPYILQFFDHYNLPVAAGVAAVALLAMACSLLASAIWNAWIKPHGRFSDALMGITIIVVGMVMLDGLKSAVGSFPVGTEDEQLVHGILVLWVGLIAFATKTPWDDLRDQATRWLRRKLERDPAGG